MVNKFDWTKMSPQQVFEMQGEKTLYQLFTIYSDDHKEMSYESFCSDFFENFVVNAASTGENCEQQFIERMEAGEPTNFRASGLIIACGYLGEAKRALMSTPSELRWYCLVEASYWLGVMQASVGIEGSYRSTLVQSRKNVAKSGGFAKADKSLPIKKELSRLLLEKMPSSKIWKSCPVALRVIEPDLRAFIAKNEGKVTRLSDLEFDDTITKWMALMPEADILFESIRKRRKNKESES